MLAIHVGFLGLFLEAFVEVAFGLGFFCMNTKVPKFFKPKKSWNIERHEPSANILTLFGSSLFLQSILTEAELGVHAVLIHCLSHLLPPTKYCSLFLTSHYNTSFSPTLFLILSRYARVTGGEGAPTFHYDRSADQSEGAAPLGPRRAEKDGRLTAGEAEATDGAGQAAAGAGRECCLGCGCCYSSYVSLLYDSTQTITLFMI